MAATKSTSPATTQDNPADNPPDPGAPSGPPVDSPPVATPSAGGSYLRDPLTGVLTLDIPSATQE